tara:strand:+ start:521 stop:835 length:315 start_codon:yes stop_codon:yes gene_type:complete
VEEKVRRKKRSFSDEFKREAVELIKKIGIQKAEKELDVGNSTLRAWRRKYDNPSQPESSSRKSYSELEKEVRRLNKENGYLREINKVLKKSTAIFSNDHMGGLK